jgi:hypothetical protein
VRHDRLVVLDDDDRRAGVDEPVEQAEQLLGVGEVEAGGFGISTPMSLRSFTRAPCTRIRSWLSAMQRRVRVLVTRERLVPTDDPA